ncbi:MAG: type II toxin-antitoxin system RelE/ParE family toxin [Pyrinomonadaceae bacterium]
MEISFSSSFKRAFKRRIAGKVDHVKNFWRIIDIFKNDPFHSSLKTHKLSGKMKHLFSFSVEYDVQVIFYFSDKNTARFIDIGTHDEVY